MTEPHILDSHRMQENGGEMANSTSTEDKVTPTAATEAAPRSAKTSGSLARGFQILDILIAANRPLTSAEIAERCGFEPSTTHRLVQNLAARGFVVRSENTKRYLASPRVLFPLPLYHPWNVIRRDAMPALTALRDHLGSTIGLVLFMFGERVLVDLAPGKDPLSPDYKPWLSSPLHASGSGKVLLMSMGSEERRRILGTGPLERFTDETVQSLEALDAELAESLERGYVLACDDYIPGFRVVAAPIRTQDGAIIGCFFSSGRNAGFPDERLKAIGHSIKQTADLFSKTTPSLRGIADFLTDRHGK